MFKLMLSAFALMLLVIGAASGVDHYGSDYGPDMGYTSGQAENDMQVGYGGSQMYDHHGPGGDHSDQMHKYDGPKHNNYYHDWLSPGYTNWYPTSYYYDYSWYKPYTRYYYTTPVTYYNWYPTVYNWDPWWAANVYGYGSTTYSYSSSWSYRNGGFFFGL